MRHIVRGTWIHPTQNLATCGLRKLHKRSGRRETGTSIADMSTRADSQFGIQNNELLDYAHLLRIRDAWDMLTKKRIQQPSVGDEKKHRHRTTCFMGECMERRLRPCARTARRTFRENVVAGHRRVATDSPCGAGGYYQSFECVERTPSKKFYRQASFYKN